MEKKEEFQEREWEGELEREFKRKNLDLNDEQTDFVVFGL